MENPFDHPPTTPPVDLTPGPIGNPGPGRGRLALVALASAGLLGASIVGVSYLVSADDPELDPPAAAAISATGDDETDTDTEPADDDDLDDGTGHEGPEIEGQITIDTGDGEPIVIDLGELGEDLPAITECFDLPWLGGDVQGGLGGGIFEFDSEQMEDLEGLFEEFPLDEMFEQFPFDEMFGEFSADGVLGDLGSSVTVTGPDGVTIIDLGDGGSVTITRNGDDLSISTDGDATATELEDLFSEFDVEGMLDEFGAGGLFDDFEMFDPELLEECIAAEE